jgi:hypothetical protein
VLEDSAAVKLRVYVIWMHVTSGDRQPPNSIVLAQVPDRRAVQFWDPYRLFSKIMMRDYPPDTAIAMADTAGGSPLIWNLVAIWKAGAAWGDRVPLPDYEGHPVIDVADTFRRRLGELARLTSPPRTP